MFLLSQKFQNRFTDLARQLEMFFLQKRFLLHAHKPELILKDDCTDLRAELQKKDELLRKHYDKLAQWQALLQDVQAGAAPPQTALGGAGSSGVAGPVGGAGSSGVPMAGRLPPGSPMQQAGPGVQQPPPGGFLPGSNFRMNPPQSPLAHLEKTTTTIGR